MMHPSALASLFAAEPTAPAVEPAPVAPAATETVVGIDPAVLDMVKTYGIEALIVLVILLVAWALAGWAGASVAKALQKARIEVTLSLFFGKLVR